MGTIPASLGPSAATTPSNANPMPQGRSHNSHRLESREAGRRTDWYPGRGLYVVKYSEPGTFSRIGAFRFSNVPPPHPSRWDAMHQQAGASPESGRSHRIDDLLWSSGLPRPREWAALPTPRRPGPRPGLALCHSHSNTWVCALPFPSLVPSLRAQVASQASPLLHPSLPILACARSHCNPIRHRLASCHSHYLVRPFEICTRRGSTYPADLKLTSKLFRLAK